MARPIMLQLPRPQAQHRLRLRMHPKQATIVILVTLHHPVPLVEDLGGSYITVILHLCRRRHQLHGRPKAIWNPLKAPSL